MIKWKRIYRNAFIIRTEFSTIGMLEVEERIQLVMRVLHDKVISDEEKANYTFARDFFNRTMTETVIVFRKDTFECFIRCATIVEKIYPTFEMLEMMMRQSNNISDTTVFKKFEITKKDDDSTTIEMAGFDPNKPTS